MAQDGRKRDRERVEHGHYAEEYPVERFLDVFVARDDPAEPLSSTEVADVLGCSRQTAVSKLDTLVDRDALRTKKIGARARVWWRSEKERSQ